MKFRKKPIVIDAVIWNGKNFDEIMNFINEKHGHKLAYENAEEAAIKSKSIYINTLEGVMKATESDYIIKGVNGEFYPCKPDIFLKSYDLEVEGDNKWIDVDTVNCELDYMKGKRSYGVTDEQIKEVEQMLKIVK